LSNKTSRAAGRNAPAAELRSALASCKSAFVGVAVVSGLVNILYLTGSFYLLEIYDRVLSSGSIPTLIAISILALMLYGFQGAFEVVRGRMLVRIAGTLDETLSARIYRAMVRAPLKVRTRGDGLQAMRDFDQVRSFLSGAGPGAFFDLPWMPLYIIICFLFHPMIGYVAIFGVVVLIILTVLTNYLTEGPSKATSEAGAARDALAQASQRNAEVIQAMGMMNRVADIWGQRNDEYRKQNRRNADVGNGLGAVSKVFRMALQSGVLAVGALLVMFGEASPGIIIASSILTSRALAPVELAIANWRGFTASRQSWARLRDLLWHIPEPEYPLDLPVPKKELRAESLSSGPPTAQKLTIGDVNFAIPAGSAMGVIGPSASGKSSMVRAIIGLWPIHRGSVRLDGAALDQWHPDELGKHIGYLPQDVELFAGTIADNISRFSVGATSEQIVAAAKAAHVHDLVLHLPDGYETEIGPHGMSLSAGQRQRVALARALFGDPFLVVLDEPNSNLDSEGEQALTQAILGVRARGGIVVVVAHRPSALAGVDLVLTMQDGRQVAFGPKDEVLAQVLQNRQQVAAAERQASTQLKIVNDDR
jgi:ATP-binding cassette subfamily C protein PrsD